MTVPFRSLTPVAADELVGMLHGRRAPGAVWLTAGPPATRAPLIAAGALTAIAIATLAVLGHGVGSAIVNAILVGVDVWLLTAIARSAWATRTLPWRPGIYAVGPHVVDARREDLIIDDLVRVAPLSSDARAVAVMATGGVVVAWTESPATAAALRARITAAEPSEPGRRDPLRELLARRRPRPGTAGEPAPLRHARITGALAAAAVVVLSLIR